MDTLNKEIKDKIVDFLGKKDFGASSSEISKNTGHNRITVTKYLEIMNANGELEVEDVAQARLWRLKSKNQKPKILIVDDEPNVVELVALSLIPGKYKAIKAYSGLDALDKVYQENPDLIILDLMMPNVDGYEVCKRIKNSSLTQHIPVIILSAKGEIKDKLQSMQLGADDYITKPFDPMEMEARVNAVLRRVRKDIDTHPLTKLPGKSSLEEEIRKKLKSKKEFHLHCFHIPDIEKFKKEKGYRRTDDTIALIARAFANTLNDFQDSFLAHTIRDKFVIVSSEKEVENAIKKTFENILPYITKNPEKPNIKIETKKVSSKKLETEKGFQKIFEDLEL